MEKYQICKRCVMDNKSDDRITFDENGYCNYCTEALAQKNNIYFPNDKGKQKLHELIQNIKNDGKYKEYDCLMGISGGLDSSYLAYLGASWGLRILALHIDDGFDTEISKNNIKKLCNAANINLITINPNFEQYCDLTASFIRANVPNVAIPQDNILFSYLYKYARKYKIHYFLSGGNFALESILQQGNTFGAYDVRNTKSIHKQFGKIKIKDLPLLSIERKFFDKKVLKIRTVTPLNFVDYNRDRALKELSDFCDFSYYGSKHLENDLTKFIQLYWFYNRYGVDKRRSHLSSMIISGQMTRDEALRELDKPLYEENEMNRDINYILSKLQISIDEFDKILSERPKQHTDYPVDKIYKLYMKCKRVTKL